MSESSNLPTHAYIPGKTPRHPEGSFDHIRETVSDTLTPEVLAQSQAFLVGLRYLEMGFFWEAHEVFEPVWMALPENGDHRCLVQALIQFANAQLKLEMGRPKAAIRLCDIVHGLLCKIGEPVVLDVETRQIFSQLDSFRQRASGVL